MMTNKEEDEENSNLSIPSRVIQVANIAAQTTRDQMQTLFGYVGKLEDIRLYPTSRDMTGMPIQTRLCYVKYINERSLPVALQLNNTIYIDRALIVTPWLDGDIPDETPALEMASTGIPGLLEPKLPNHCVNHIQGIPPKTMLSTYDPNLRLNKLPPYPILPARTDGRTMEETRRTLVLVDIDPNVTAKEVFDFFSEVGSQVAYYRLCKSQEDEDAYYGLVEFGKQEEIVNAFKQNGKMLGSREAKIAHSITNIQKPQMKSSDVVQKEIEEAMKMAKDSSLLFSALDGDKKRSRSRSLSRGRHRSNN
nr:EOG090X0EEC [Artemia franciscana]